MKVKRKLLYPIKKPEYRRFSTHASVDLSSSCKREDKDLKDPKLHSTKENTMPTNQSMANHTVSRTFVLRQSPIDNAKDSMMVSSDRIFKSPFYTRSGYSSLVTRKKENHEGGNCRILVFVRLRPMAKKEKEADSRCCVRIENTGDVYLTEFANDNDYLRAKSLRGRHFRFDASFPDSTTQHEVYSITTVELVEAVLQGKNGSVFCYGATGAGKTYTMLGTVENPGVMVLAIKDLFAKIRQKSCDGNHVVHLSYLEVYNETVRDLLSPGGPLVLREDKKGIVMAAGLTQHRASSTDEVMALLQRGNRNRTTEPTRVNKTSSRSHAILQLVVEYRIKDASMNVVNRVGKLSLIDLAGSERVLASDQTTLRSNEGANINRSLLALSGCINALVEGKKHVPFRNSKLTQLMKGYLGGACNTVMIANISPSNLSFGETQNTLHWADRAKEIRTKASEAHEEIQRLPKFETDQASKLILELQKENRELRSLLKRQQQKLLTVQAQYSDAVSSPTTPSLVTFLLTPPYIAQANESREAAGEVVRDLRLKALEAEIERIKKDHSLQLKEKDKLIHKLSQKDGKLSVGGGLEGTKRIVTRASLRPKEVYIGEELKRPIRYQYRSQAPISKRNQSFWEITTTNSPSVSMLRKRKTRSHFDSEPAANPHSMLLQPGFSRQRRWIL